MDNIEDDNFKLTNRVLKAFLKVFFVFILMFCFTLTASAEEGYNAEEVSRTSGEIHIKPNTAITFEIKYKNTGTETWLNYGENFMELVTVEPELRKSFFFHKFWEKSYLPARLKEKEVKPNEIGTFTIALQSPEVEDFYLEKFKLVARRLAWVDGGELNLPIYVYEKNLFDIPQKKSTETVEEKVVEEIIEIPASFRNAAGKLIIGSIKDEIILHKNTTKSIKLGFKNIGEVVWNNNDKNYVSIYTYNPKYRISNFYDQNTWQANNQIKLKTEEVKKGEIGYFEFDIKAGDIVGDYTESFRLALEEYSWVYGTDFNIKIKVIEPPVKEIINELVENSEIDPNLVQVGNKDYEAHLLIDSGKTIRVEKGKQFSYKVGFKNIGQEVWYKNNKNFVSLYTVMPRYRKSVFTPTDIAGTSWLSESQIQIQDEEISSGGVGYFMLNFQAPEQAGEYLENFKLAIENKTWVEGGDITVKIIVEDSVSLETSEHIDQNYVSYNTDTVHRIEEPVLRVGLFKPEEALQIRANADFKIVDKNNKQLLYLYANEIVEINYSAIAEAYNIKSDKTSFNTNLYIRLEPIGENTIFEIVNYEQRPAWNKNYNDNKFRGILELRYNTNRNRTWIINEIGMEEYLYGLIETSNYNPIEYLKTMTIAARTYALYHYNSATKHQEEYFDVDAYYDQVYRGYGSEERMPRLVQATKDTHGKIVTYNGHIAVTPYFARSDGYTRSWEEVWGGEGKPWIEAVVDPYCAGKTMMGHGVGLSAIGALEMARKENKTYLEILNYYYKNIEIESFY